MNDNGNLTNGQPDMLAAALDYVNRGLAVVPLHTVRQIGEWMCTCNRRPCPDKPGKHPQQGYGLHHACTNENQVRHAWERMPDGNIGLVVPKGVVVLDLDGAVRLRVVDRRERINGSALLHSNL